MRNNNKSTREGAFIILSPGWDSKLTASVQVVSIFLRKY